MITKMALQEVIVLCCFPYRFFLYYMLIINYLTKIVLVIFWNKGC